MTADPVRLVTFCPLPPRHGRPRDVLFHCPRQHLDLTQCVQGTADDKSGEIDDVT
jgi:hypothetical protein